MMLLVSAGGNRVPVIAQMVQADEDTVREAIHRFNEIGLTCLGPQWAGGRPRLLSRDDEDFVIRTATTRPSKLGQPFIRWSIRKLAAYLRKVHGRVIRIGREALRACSGTAASPSSAPSPGRSHPPLIATPSSTRSSRRWNASRTGSSPSTSSGPLGIRPTAGSCWAKQGKPNRLPATYRRTHGVTYFHGCYSMGDDRLWGVNRCRKGTANTLATLKSIRAARPDGAPIYIILDNLSAHTGADIRRWAKKNKVELCFTPTYASWANPIEAHFGPLRQFALANSHHRSYPAQTQALHRYLPGATPTPATERASSGEGQRPKDDSGGGRLDLPREDDDLVDEAPSQMDDVRSRQAGASMRRGEDPLVPGPFVRHVHR